MNVLPIIWNFDVLLVLAAQERIIIQFFKIKKKHRHFLRMNAIPFKVTNTHLEGADDVFECHIKDD